jgi:predicted acetyltransferase
MKELKLLRLRLEDQEKSDEAAREELQCKLQASQAEEKLRLERIGQLEKELAEKESEGRALCELHQKSLLAMEREHGLLKAQLDSRLQLNDNPREGAVGSSEAKARRRGFFLCGG